MRDDDQRGPVADGIFQRVNHARDPFVYIVLIGAAAAGERARVYEAAVLKTLGAERRQIFLSFALRAAILGAAAGGVALAAGITAGWAVMVYVMDAEFSVAWARL